MLLSWFDLSEASAFALGYDPISAPFGDTEHTV